MDLTEPLKRQLVDSVHTLIGSSADPDTIRILIGAGALVQMPSGLNGHRSARWVVRHSLTRTTPDVFVRVVEEADKGEALGELQELVARLKQDPSTWSASVGDGLWVPTGWPFIDRASLRDVLEEIVAGDGPAALAIEGSFGQGKRTMAEYVRYLADETGSFSAAVVELRPVPDMLFSTVSEIYAAFGGDEDLDTTHAEPERQATVLAKDVATAAGAAPAPTWFVANVFDHGNLEDGVLAFVDELLGLVQATPAIGKKLRVLLLCDQLSLLALENSPMEARYTLPSINEMEVRQWLEAAEPGKADLLYQLTAERVMRKMQNPNLESKRWLTMLSRQCAVAHKELAAMGDA